MRGDQLDRQRLSLRDPPRGFHLDAFMRQSFKVIHDERHTVKVRMSSAWARWVGEKAWQESQRVDRWGSGLGLGTRDSQFGVGIT